VTVQRDGKLVTFYSGTGEPDKGVLARSLPKYMLPSAFVRLDKLPRSGMGKIDRKALPSPEVVTAREIRLNTATEVKLAKIWRETLDLAEVSREDDFERLGGDSLAVMALTYEIERVFGKTLSPTEIFMAGALETLAALIDGHTTGDILVRLKDGARDPLYFVHTANAGAESYRGFARYLPDGQPLRVFDHYNLLYANGKYEGVRELAARYADLLPKAGRYRLGGWSFGGIVAFEMALLLQERGVDSELFLFDPTIYTDAEREILSGRLTAPHYYEYLEKNPLFERFRDRGQLDELVRNNAFALRENARYVPNAVFRGDVTLYRMTLPDEVSEPELKRLWELKSADNGFGGYAEKLRVVDVADTHDNSLTNEKTILRIIGDMEASQ
jgi:thioesterase domain-containing protein/acyl carrier protein